jgi:Uma2 family endonuclease
MPQDALKPVADHRVLMSGISWETFQRLVDELERAGCHRRLCYDNGWLEISTRTPAGEARKCFVRSLLQQTLLANATPFAPFGETTWQRPDLRMGIEADESYYIRHEAQIGPRCDLKLGVDPPPDLAIEIETAPPLLDRSAVYAAIGVPEIWVVPVVGPVRLSVLRGGAYEAVDRSDAVPQFTVDVLNQWLKRYDDTGFIAVMASLREQLDSERVV